MQPGRPLGIDIALDGSNIITGIGEDGLVAELNKAHPNTIEAGDKIVKVDGKQTDNAVEQIRAWVKRNQGKPGDMPLTVSRRAFTFKQMLLRGDFKEMSEPNSALRKPSSAWRYSVQVRLRPGQSLGLNLCIDNNAISEIDDPGAAADLNKEYPGSIRVGDRVLAVDGTLCPCKNSAAELESWFKRILSHESKGKEKSVRLTVLRPVEWGAGVAVLPPCDAAVARREEGGRRGELRLDFDDSVPICLPHRQSAVFRCVQQGADGLERAIPRQAPVFRRGLRRCHSAGTHGGLGALRLPPRSETFTESRSAER